MHPSILHHFHFFFNSPFIINISTHSHKTVYAATCGTRTFIPPPPVPQTPHPPIEKLRHLKSGRGRWLRSPLYNRLLCSPAGLLPGVLQCFSLGYISRGGGQHKKQDKTKSKNGFGEIQSKGGRAVVSVWWLAFYMAKKKKEDEKQNKNNFWNGSSVHESSRCDELLVFYAWFVFFSNLFMACCRSR